MSQTTASKFDAFERFFTDDLAQLEDKLATEIGAATSPTLTAKGNPIKRDNYIEARLTMLRDVQGKLALYERVVENRVTSKLDSLRTTLEKHFTTLLGGGDVVGWKPELLDSSSQSDPTPPSSDEESTPSTQRSVSAPGSETLAAAPSAEEDPFGWC